MLSSIHSSQMTFALLNARERLQSNFISKTLTVLCLMEKVIAIFVKVLHSYDKRI